MKTFLQYFLIITLLFFSSFTFGNTPQTSTKNTKSTLAWIKNNGQFNKSIAYSSKTFVADISIRRNKNIEYYIPVKGNKRVRFQESFLSYDLQSKEIIGNNKSRTIVNYFGKTKTIQNIPSYNSLSLGELWLGINVELKATPNNFEKVFTVEPNIDTKKIRIKMDGISDLCINENEELQVDLEDNSIIFTKPIAYQNINGEKVLIPVSYNTNKNGDFYSYGFELGNYNKDLAITIDPLLASTYLGGSMIDLAKKVKVANSNIVYVAGSSSSIDFPSTLQSFDPTYNSDMDVFVAAFSNDLTELKTCTFIGGTNGDYLSDMVLDNDDNVYITGKTKSADYPTTTNAFDTIFNSSGEKRYSDIMISMFNPHLDTLVYSTFVGNDLDDFATAMDIDNQGDILITGFSKNGILPVGLPQFNPFTKDLIFFKMDNTLSNILASNSIASDTNTTVSTDITHDSYNNVFITGNTDDKYFPTTIDSYQDTLVGDIDAFVLKINNDLNNIIAATYLGGKSIDLSVALLSDNLDNIILTGSTFSPRFPTTENAYDTIYSNNSNSTFPDAFLCKMDNNLNTVISSTFIGGQGYESGADLAVDSQGNIFVAGVTNSIDFPVFCNSYDNSYNGNEDCFIVGINPDLSNLKVSTLYGSKNEDRAFSIFIDANNSIYISGYTKSTDLADSTSYDNSYNGVGDGLVFKMSDHLDKPYPCCSELLSPQNYSTGIPRDIKLIWSKARGATGYYVSLGTSADSFDILNHFNNGNDTLVSLDSLPCGETIFVHIYPYNSNGINNDCQIYQFNTIEPFIDRKVYDICEGDSINWRGNTYYQAGEYEENYIDIFGCDSTYSLKLNVHYPFYEIDTIFICDGDIYSWQGNDYGTQGKYYQIDTSIYGCDSTYQLDLYVYDVFTQNDTATICQNSYYEWHGSNYTLPGNYIKVYTDQNGCDSTYYLNLIVKPNYLFEENATICQNESYYWQGNIYDSTGTYFRTYTSIFGCDSIYKLSLNVNPVYNLNITESICQGDTFYFSDTLFFESGKYSVELYTSEGCDSIINLSLIVNPAYNLQDTISICEGDTIYYGSEAFFEEGEYTINQQTVMGCDSTTQLTLHVLPVFYQFDTLSLCIGDTISWEGMQITQAGDYTNSATTTCDSIVNLNVYTLPTYQIYDTIHTCLGDTIVWQGLDIHHSGIYTKSYQTIDGCDSIFHLNLKAGTNYLFTQDIEICQNDTIYWQDTILTTSGIYYSYYKTKELGCDSTYRVYVTQTLIDTSVTVSNDTLYAVSDSFASYQWLKCPELSIIDGADRDTYIASESGSYMVRIVKGGCVDTSNCHYVIATKTDELQIQNVKIYPNPVYNNIIFTNITNYDGDYTLRINNLQGQKVCKRKKTNNSKSIDISNLRSGIYIATVNYGKYIYHQKIIVLQD